MEIENIPERERILPVLKRFCVSERQINSRSFECPDVFREKEQALIYLLTPTTPSGVDIKVRHQFYSKRAQEVMKEIYDGETTPDHLVHVTCTGYVSPSAPQMYFSEKESSVEITHAYHMGCYASIPAVRMAESFSSHRRQKVDVVHTEMCSLHLNPALHTPEQMVQSLFADGHIKYSLDQEFQGRRFEVVAIKEKLIANSSEDMTWIPSPVGMHMTLSKEVPEKIKGSLVEFLREMASENGIKIEDLLKHSLFAIHPGGPKIIDAIEEKLELLPHQTVAAHQILKERGNMSSATLPHIWNEILESNYEGRVVSLAFGPGLTIFGAIFEAK
jgi:predicted naringenin-chalcone synthase